jgi:predicted methyltransferase
MAPNLDLLAQKVGLTPAQAEGLLALFGQGITNRQLSVTTGLAKSTLDDFREEVRFYLLPSSDKTVLNDQGKRWVERITPRSFKWQRPSFGEIPAELDKIFNRYKNQREKTNRKLDQFRATRETVWRRAALMKERGDLFRRRLLFLGDADWTGLAAAYLGQAKRIFVLDVDQGVLDGLTMASQENNFKIEILKHDLLRPLPNHLLNNFDVVFSDPPYTDNGVGLFLSRSVEAIDKNQASRIYFCYGQSDRAREKTLKIQTLINRLGLLIEECRPQFNRYHGAVSIGSSSSLYINSLTGKTKPTIVGHFKKSIYTWQK